MDTDDPQPQDAGSDSSEYPLSQLQYDEPWLGSLLRPFLITLLVGCLDIALLAFLHRLVPSITLAYTQMILFMGVATALIGCYTTTLLVRPEHRSRRNLGYRLAELGLLLAVTRIFIWAITNTWPSAAMLIVRPIDALLDGFFVLGGLVVIVSWILASTASADFVQMALQPDELAELESLQGTARYDYFRGSYVDRSRLLQQFMGRWMLGGVVLVVLTAASQLGLGGSGFFALIRQDIDPAVIWAAVCYFLAGLLLIGQGRLAALRARWQINHIPSQSSVMRNWPIYVFILVFTVAVVASLLPFGGTFRLAQIIGALFHFMYLVLNILFSLLMALLALLLPGGDRQQPEQAPAAFPERIEPAPPPGLALPPWFTGAVFWTLMALILGYATVVYLGGKGVNLAWLRRLWLLLRLRWQDLFGAYTEWQRSWRAANERRASAQGGRMPWGALHLLRLGRMDPSQQVRYFYLSTLQRAERSGVGRRPGETPLHYAPRLVDAVTEQVEDEPAVNTLTDAFVQVYYAARPAVTAQIPLLKHFWERLKRALRSRRIERA